MSRSFALVQIMLRKPYKIVLCTVQKPQSFCLADLLRQALMGDNKQDELVAIAKENEIGDLWPQLPRADRDAQQRPRSTVRGFHTGYPKVTSP